MPSVKTLLSLALLAGLLGSPAQARNFAVPAKDPAMSLSVPDNWKTDEIEYGYSAMSPGEDVFFSVEYAGARGVDALMKANDAWMKENKIADVTPDKAEGTLNGIPFTAFHFDTTDATGPTEVEFIMMPGGHNRMVMLTVWGSKQERAKHQAEIDGIMHSVKPLG